MEVSVMLKNNRRSVISEISDVYNPDLAILQRQSNIIGRRAAIRTQCDEDTEVESVQASIQSGLSISSPKAYTALPFVFRPGSYLPLQYPPCIKEKGVGKVRVRIYLRVTTWLALIPVWTFSLGTSGTVLHSLRSRLDRMPSQIQA